MPDDPVGPLAAAAAAAKEMFETYMSVGFDRDCALYLTGCVVSTMSTAMLMRYDTVEGYEDAARTAVSERMDALRRGLTEDDRPMSARFAIQCALCGAAMEPVGSDPMTCPNTLCAGHNPNPFRMGGGAAPTS